MSEIDAAELARLRAALDWRDISDREATSLIDALEKARAETTRLRAQRDSARALLREALPWVRHMCMGLRARIAAELGE